MRIISQSKLFRHPVPQAQLDHQAEQEDAAEDDGESQEIGGGGGRREVEPERGDEPADEAAGPGIAGDQASRPGGDDQGDGDRQESEQARQEYA